MASTYSAWTCALGKKDKPLASSRLRKSSLLPAFEGQCGLNSIGKGVAVNFRSMGARATLTFDPPSTKEEKSTMRKLTVDPAAPHFLPLPSFKQYFPRTRQKNCVGGFALLIAVSNDKTEE